MGGKCVPMVTFFASSSDSKLAIHAIAEVAANSSEPAAVAGARGAGASCSPSEESLLRWAIVLQDCLKRSCVRETGVRGRVRHACSCATLLATFLATLLPGVRCPNGCIL